MPSPSEWRDLRTRATEQHHSVEVLLEGGFVDKALEAAHLSLEIAMKTAISKKGGVYAHTHNLKDLADVKIQNKKFLANELKSTKFIRPIFNRVHSAWRMGYRYTRVPYTSEDKNDLIEDFGRVYQWILTNFVD